MRPRPLPSILSSEPFLVADALDMVGAERLRRLDLSRPTRGLRLMSAQQGDVRLTPPLLARLLGPLQHFSHLTAAEIWRIPVPRSAEIHTTTVGTGSVTRRPGVIGHRISPDRAHRDMVAGLPVTARVACWVECASMLPLDELVVFGDHLVGQAYGHPLSELGHAVARSGGCRGVARLRDAFGLVRVGAESPRETKLRLLIHRRGLPEAELNVNTYDDTGTFIGRPDLRYPDQHVYVEFDGDHHRTDRWTYRNDIRRRERFVAAGWHALHVSDDDLTIHSEEFLTHLEAALVRRDRRHFR